MLLVMYWSKDGNNGSADRVRLEYSGNTPCAAAQRVFAVYWNSSAAIIAQGVHPVGPLPVSTQNRML